MRIKSLLGMLVLSFAAATAQASVLGQPSDHSFFQYRLVEYFRGQHDFKPAVSSAVSSVVAAPEIDPAGALSAFTLLVGGLAVVRGRRSKK